MVVVVVVVVIIGKVTDQAVSICLFHSAWSRPRWAGEVTKMLTPCKNNKTIIVWALLNGLIFEKKSTFKSRSVLGTIGAAIVLSRIKIKCRGSRSIDAIILQIFF